MNDLPKYLQNTPAGPIPTNAPAPRQVYWLREHIRSYAQFQAMLHISGEAVPPEGEAELLLAAINTATEIGWSRDTGIAAARAEWAAALERVRGVADRIVQAVRPRVLRKESGEAVLAAAKAADPDAILPTEVLISFCAKIAQAGFQRRVRA